MHTQVYVQSSTLHTVSVFLFFLLQSFATPQFISTGSGWHCWARGDLGCCGAVRCIGRTPSHPYITHYHTTPRSFFPSQWRESTDGDGGYVKKTSSPLRLMGSLGIHRSFKCTIQQQPMTVRRGRRCLCKLLRCGEGTLYQVVPLVSGVLN